MMTSLSSALKSEGLRSKIIGIYDAAQTFALTNTLADVEGLEEDRREHYAHCAGVEAVTIWLKAVRTARAFTPTLTSIVDNLGAHDRDDQYVVVDEAVTELR